MKRRASQLSLSTSATVEGPESSHGYVSVVEGSIYWRLDAVNDRRNVKRHRDEEDEDDDEDRRPTIFLTHAGVADHAMWDEQVRFLNRRGWRCLRIDMFGFGQSQASEEYLSSRRPPHSPSDHIELIRQKVLGEHSDIILIGLSVGANLSLAYTLAHPEHVTGLCLISGGPRGFEAQNEPEEDALLDKVESLLDLGDVHGAAQMQVRIWGDGPLQEPGRLPDDIATRMLRWNTDIAAREFSKRGGGALEQVLAEPAPIARLHTVRIPTAVAWGALDETFTRRAMEYVAGNVAGAVSRVFETAHMVNLEREEEFNEFVGDWLEENFEREEDGDDEDMAETETEGEEL